MPTSSPMLHQCATYLRRDALAAFLNEILNHRASVISQHRRGAFWAARSYTPDLPPLSGIRSDSEMPPADTGVLLGYVRDLAHLDWIRAHSRYNLRAGERRGAVGLSGPELGAELLVLYGPSLLVAQIARIEGQPEVWGPARMTESGYHATQHTYFCLAIKEAEIGSLPQLTTALVSQLARQAIPGAARGAPAVVTWLDVVKSLSNSGD